MSARSLYRRAFSTATPARRPSSAASSRSWASNRRACAETNVRAPRMPAAPTTGHDHDRVEADGAHELEVLVVDGVGDERLVRRLVDDRWGMSPRTTAAMPSASSIRTG